MLSEAQSNALQRLKSIEGHVRGIQRMIEEDDYCIDIIRQGQAVQAAIGKVNQIVLGNHLETCVTTAIRSEDRVERERVIRELMEVYDVADKL